MRTSEVDHTTFTQLQFEENAKTNIVVDLVDRYEASMKASVDFETLLVEAQE